MEKPNIVIIDYQLSNLFSVIHACEFLGLNVKLSSEKMDILEADALILPGVGAFADAMNNLHKLDLVSPIKDRVAEGIPFMGVCLGLQLLFSESEEFGTNKGLDLVSGVVKKFPAEYHGHKIRIPQIGWNRIYKPHAGKDWTESPLVDHDEKDFVYFVHSFYVEPEEIHDVLALTDYSGFEYCSAIEKDNIFATQFHPEKSGELGLKMYANWAKTI